MKLCLMLRPLNSVQVHSLLHKFPQRTHLPQNCDPVPDSIKHVIDLSLSGKPADSKADARVRALIARPEGPEDITGL